ncbi:MAG: hypothetical protein ACXWTS_01040 [Methylococcaceae bacterium]
MQSQKILANLYQNNQDITEALSAINDSECQLKSRELLKVFKKNLELLKHSYLLLNEPEFYLEGAKALEQTSHRVKAVDTLQVDWDGRGALLNYYDGNLKALARGVQITRIFVISRHDTFDQNVQKTLYKQSQDGIDVRITYRENLLLNNDEISVHSLDFAIYNDALVTERGLDNGSFLGKKIKKSAEIEKYLRLFDLIEQHSYRLTSESIQTQFQLIDTLPI